MNPGWEPPSELVNAFAHFAGGFIRERDGEDVPGRDATGGHIGDAAGDGAGFARAGAGEDEEGAIDGVVAGTRWGSVRPSRTESGR